MYIIRFMLGMFSAMLLGASGLFLVLLKIPTEIGFTPPNPQYINIHFLGQSLIVFAVIMLIMTLWYTPPAAMSDIDSQI